MSWDFKPSVVIGCCALLACYAIARRGRLDRCSLLWVTGVALIFVLLCSPLDELGDRYLFSVHMARHILFVLVVPALLLLGFPRDLAARALDFAPVRAPERFLRTPAIAWASGIGVMALWHIPALFNAALASEPLHITEHLSLLVCGSIYWWPVLSPLQGSRLKPVPQAAAYLFTSCLACTGIGIAITFAPSVLYQAYAQANAVRDSWGITALTDQQTGGLLMWVPGCVIYFAATMAMFARWYSEEPEAEAI